MPLNPAAKSGFLNSVKEGAKSMAGITEKAVIEIADMSELKIKKQDAQKITTNKTSIGNVGEFNADSVKKFASSITGSEQGFDIYGDIKKRTFEVQFNPEDISISGYGGEELPIQNYRKNGKGSDPDYPSGSHMAAADTRIEFNVKLVFDKSNPQDAFYADKFTLSQTNIAKGVGRLAKTAIKGNYTSVQPEIEALTAIVRDEKMRLIRFVWGDMAYEGVLSTVSADYVMFNVNGEPCRAFVNLGIILFDNDVAGTNQDIWQKEYMTDFYSLNDKAGGLKPNISI